MRLENKRISFITSRYNFAGRSMGVSFNVLFITGVGAVATVEENGYLFSGPYVLGVHNMPLWLMTSPFYRREP